MALAIPDVISEITRAFENVRLDDGISIQQARALDDYASVAGQLAARAKDTEERWQDVPEEKLRNLEDVHAFLCPKGFRFYIPAYMIWVLHHLELHDRDSQLSESTVYSLDIGRPSDPWHADRKERFDLLDVRQKESVILFLECLIAEGDYETDARRYLADYWNAYRRSDHRQ